MTTRALRYRVAGRLLESDLPFEDLGSEPAGEQPVTLTIAEGDPRLPGDGDLARTVDDPDHPEPFIAAYRHEAGFRWLVRGIGEFAIHDRGRRIDYRLHPDASPTDAEHFLLGPATGVALQMQGVVLVHASAVRFDGRAVAFAGPSGFGKSTLAAACLRAGATLLADDVLAVEPGSPPMALPYLPRLKLWGDSLGFFGAQPGRYRPVLSRFEKRRVPAAALGAFTDEPVPLGVIYLLHPLPPEQARIAVTEVQPAEAALELITDMYMADLYSPQRAAAHLAAIGGLVEAVPVRALEYPHDEEALARLVEHVRADLGRADA